MDKAKQIGSASARNSGEVYRTSVEVGMFQFIADEPVEYGGGATGPTPADYLCMALASCKVITIRMYARRKGWNVEQVDVSVSFLKTDQEKAGQNRFLCEIRLSGNLDDQQCKRIVEIARICPVERLLGKQNEVVTVLQEEK